MQRGPGGPRGRHALAYMANESGPTCFSVIDVTDARNPTVLKTIDIPGPNTRCNNLDASGNLLVVANQTEEAGQTPAGVQIFDISDRADPEQVDDRGVIFAGDRFSGGLYVMRSSVIDSAVGH